MINTFKSQRAFARLLLALVMLALVSLVRSAENGIAVGEQFHVNAPVAFSCESMGGLATSSQIEQERLLTAVLRDPRLQRAVKDVEALYASDPQAMDAAGRLTIPHAARSIVAAMAEWGVIKSRLPENFLWTNKTAHSWFGLDVPNSGYGIENPDNVYRHLSLASDASYRIRGKLPEHLPLQQSFIVYAKMPGTGEMTREGAGIVGLLDNVLPEDDGGTFLITLDRDPANGRKNHLQIPEEAALLIIRDSLSDWSRELPVELEVEVLRQDSARPLGYSHEAAVEYTLDLLKTTPKYWVDYDNTYIFSREANTPPVPRVRPSGWGGSTSGHFDLARDEALVITLQDMGARYLGFQLADVWGVALDYVNRSSSLSNHQVKRNADGTVTYVIAPEDPGHYNWLDSSGLERGIFAIRWQNFREPQASIDGAILSAQIKKLDEVKRSTVNDFRMDPAARKAQIDDRTLGYLNRLGCLRS